MSPAREGWLVEAQTKSMCVSAQTPLTNSNDEAGWGLPSGPAGI